MLARLLKRLTQRTSLASDPKRLGQAGERFAARYLRRKGYRILTRNARLKHGEADIVCECPHREAIVIVEVKTRLRGSGRSIQGETVAPEASVTSRKRAKLAAILQTLRRANGWERRPMRVDVVAIEWPSGRGRPRLRHHESVMFQRADVRNAAR